MTVALPRSELVRIHAHARETYPEECCGFLIGTQDLRRVVVEIRRTANVRSDDRRTRYTIDPRETLRLDRELRGTEREIVGFYHSHPDVPAVPSAFDHGPRLARIRVRDRLRVPRGAEGRPRLDPRGNGNGKVFYGRGD